MNNSSCSFVKTGLLGTEFIHVSVFGTVMAADSLFLMNAFDGAILLSSTALGLSGNNPHFRKPLIIFKVVREGIQASATSDDKISGVTTRPGCFARQLEHDLEKLLLNDLNTPTSSGCRM